MGEIHYFNDPIGQQPRLTGLETIKAYAKYRVLDAAIAWHLTGACDPNKPFPHAELPSAPVDPELMDPVMEAGHAYSIPEEEQVGILDALLPWVELGRRIPGYEVRIEPLSDDHSHLRYLIINHGRTTDDDVQGALNSVPLPEAQPAYEELPQMYQAPEDLFATQPEDTGNITRFPALPGTPVDQTPVYKTLAADITVVAGQPPHIDKLTFGFLADRSEDPGEPNILQFPTPEPQE